MNNQNISPFKIVMIILVLRCFGIKPSYIYDKFVNGNEGNIKMLGILGFLGLFKKPGSDNKYDGLTMKQNRNGR